MISTEGLCTVHSIMYCLSAENKMLHNTVLDFLSKRGEIPLKMVSDLVA